MAWKINTVIGALSGEDFKRAKIYCTDESLSTPFQYCRNDISTIINEAYQTLKADRISLFIQNGTTNLLDCIFSKDIEGISISTEFGLAGASFKSGKLLNVPDIRSDKRHYNTIDKSIVYITSNLLCCPIFSPTR